MSQVRRVARALATASMIVALAAPAAAAVKMLDCKSMAQWLTAAYQGDQKAGIRDGQRGTQQLTALRDDVLGPLFDATLDKWTDADFNNLYQAAWACEKQMRATKRPSGSEAAALYSGLVYGMTYLGMRNRVQDYVATIRHQLMVRSETAKAEALLAGQTAEIAAMEPSGANAALLNQMQAAAPRDLAYLPPAKLQQHRQALRRKANEMGGAVLLATTAPLGALPATLDGFKTLLERRAAAQQDLRPFGAAIWRQYMQSSTRVEQRIADGIVTALLGEVDRMQSSATGLVGLRELIAFRQDLAKTHQGVRSNVWKQFKTRYETAVNALAEAALADFKAELAALPPDQAGLAQAKGAVLALFPIQPLPASVNGYRAAAKVREAELRAEIERIACEERLAAHDLVEAARLPMLGPEGEATFAWLLCKLGEGRYVFEGYEEPGFLGKTHSLRLRSPSGIATVVELRQVEAVSGREMLAGVLIKDASSEKELSLADWQDLIKRLALGARWN